MTKEVADVLSDVWVRRMLLDAAGEDGKVEWGERGKWKVR